MATLRVCLVTTFYPPFNFGGDGICVYRLAHALADRGHRVDVVHSEDAYRLAHSGTPPAQFDEHPGVTRHVLKTRRPLLNSLTAHQLGSLGPYRPLVEDLFERKRFDVIHYHNTSLVGGPGILKSGSGLKLYTPHDYWLICPTHVLFAFNAEACTHQRCLRCTLHAKRPPQWWRYTGHLADAVRHIDLFLMPSQFALERHRSSGLDVPMTVLPNFVPAAPAFDKTAPAASDRPFFLFVGRLEKLKGVQDLLKIFATYRDADLIIAGSGNYRDVLERQASGLSHVKFLGNVHPEELGRYYRQAVAVLMPSLCYEVFPLIPAEAFMHATPVIGRRIGALAEVVNESGGGVLFDTREECRQAMHQLQGNPVLRRKLGAAGQRCALERWTTDAHVDRYLDLISGLREERQSA